MRAFFDTSALAKRYLLEPGREKVEAVLRDATEAAVSIVCVPELVSALSRLRRQSALSDDDCARVKAAFFADVEGLTVRAVSIPVVETAIGLIETIPLKTLDALQIGCALEWRADLFVSADRRQLAAAARTGLRVRAV
jgi:predicted nucleic acid-binding protein